MNAMTSERRAVLAQLLEACEAGDGQVFAARFRADHADELKLLDQLVQERYILQDREQYRVSLTSLVQLDSPIAAGLLEQAEWLWEGLRNHYKVHLGELVAVTDLARACGLGLGAAQHTLRYMLEAPWYGGFTPGGDQAIQAIAANEVVLKHKTLSALIEEMRSWTNVDTACGVFPCQSAGEVAVAEGLASGSLLAMQTLPEWLPKLPTDAQALMLEVHAASAAGLHALAAMGIRAVVDVVCKDQLGGDAGSFAAKIKALRDAGHMTEVQHTALLAVVDAGHAAAHRGFIPDPGSVRAMMGALGHLLQSLYVLQDLAIDLGRVTPRRSMADRQGPAVSTKRPFLSR